MKRRTIIKAAVVSAVSGIRAAGAQPVYPDHPIRLVVPFSPGGSTDLLARKLANQMQRTLGQALVIDNKAGASGITGCVDVARAKPDGYTLCMATSGTHTVLPSAMVHPSYDPVADYASIALVSTQPFALSVNSAVPARNVSELVELIRRNPDKYSFASPCTGGIAHLAGELFKQLTNLPTLLHVPFKGGGQAMPAVLSGEVPIFFDSLSTDIPYHKSGKIRLLAVLDHKRSNSMPEIPTAIEQGFKDFVVLTASILVAPAHTSNEILNTLNKHVRLALADPQFQKDVSDLGLDLATNLSPENGAKFIKEELAKWRPIIQKAGVRLDI